LNSLNKMGKSLKKKLTDFKIWACKNPYMPHNYQKGDVCTEQSHSCELSEQIGAVYFCMRGKEIPFENGILHLRKHYPVTNPKP